MSKRGGSPAQGSSPKRQAKGLPTPTPSSLPTDDPPSTLQRKGSIPGAGLEKRGIPSKETYFMSLAKLASLRSRDPSMQVGACLVDSTGRRVLGIGYNGAPCSINDNRDFPWQFVEDDSEDTKKCKNDYVIHAEANALALSDPAFHQGATMFCTHYPCKDCAKAMIHAGVKTFVYFDDSRKDKKDYEPSVRLLNFAQEKKLAYNRKYDGKPLMVQDEKFVKKYCCETVAENLAEEYPSDDVTSGTTSAKPLLARSNSLTAEFI